MNVSEYFNYVQVQLIVTLDAPYLVCRTKTLIIVCREENERRVKQVLVELGEDLRLSAEREVEELQLPMRDADIQRLCKQSQTRALQGSVNSSTA